MLYVIINTLWQKLQRLFPCRGFVNISFIIFNKFCDNCFITILSSCKMHRSYLLLFKYDCNGGIYLLIHFCEDTRTLFLSIVFKTKEMYSSQNPTLHGTKISILLSLLWLVYQERRFFCKTHFYVQDKGRKFYYARWKSLAKINAIPVKNLLNSEV